MTRWIPITVLIVVWTGTCSAAGQTAKGTYTNPVIDEIGPADPAVVRFEGTYYMYCTGDNSSYHVYTSRDLVHWTKGRRVFVPGDRNVWAPDVFRDPNDEQFYLYYTVDKRIGVAVAERPDATFQDRVSLFDNAIDAHMFCEGGKYYLYYVQLPGFRIHVQRMKGPLEKLGRAVHQAPGQSNRTSNGQRLWPGTWLCHRGRGGQAVVGLSSAEGRYAALESIHLHRSAVVR